MALGDEPRPMGENLVHFVKIAQLGGDAVQSLKPTFIASLLQEFRHLLFNQKRTLVTTSRLKITTKNSTIKLRIKKKRFILVGGEKNMSNNCSQIVDNEVARHTKNVPLGALVLSFSVTGSFFFYAHQKHLYNK